MTNDDGTRIRHRVEKARIKQYFHRRGTCTIALKLRVPTFKDYVWRGALASISLSNELKTVVETLDVSA